MNVTKKYIKRRNKRFPWHISAQRIVQGNGPTMIYPTLCGAFSGWEYGPPIYKDPTRFFDEEDEVNAEMVCRNCVREENKS